MLTPRKTTSWSRWRCQVASRSLASALHGGHHDAQKLRKTTLPRNSVNFTSRPSISRSVNGGAWRPMRGEGISRGSRVKPYASTAISGRPIPKTSRRRFQAILRLSCSRPERPERQERPDDDHPTADPDPAHQGPQQNFHRRLARLKLAET